MVILNRVYSETDLFDHVEFHKGINTIMGKYSKKPREKSSDLNGVGKSTLVRLIDFCLCADTSQKKYFSVKEHEFLDGHSSSLEFSVDEKKYKITRKFSKPDNIFFGNIEKMDEFKIAEMRKILGSLFFRDIDYSGKFQNKWFRTLMRFFVKDDIDYHERKNPLKFYNNRANKFDSYVYNLYLMNIPNQSVFHYKEYKDKKNELNDSRKKLLSYIEEYSNKNFKQIKSDIRLIEERINKYEKSIEKYEFSDSYKQIEKEIILLSNNISQLLRKINIMQKKLNEYKKSYDYDIEINIDEISKIYKETKNIFGELIKKELEEVIEFRRKLSENRMRFLQNKEHNLKMEINRIYSKISFLEKKRSELYSLLDERETLDSLKNTYYKMIKEKTEREQYLTHIHQIEYIDEKIYDINNKISKNIQEISKDVNSSESDIKELHSFYINNIRNMTKAKNVKNAVFDISSSPDFRSPIKVDVEVPKSSSLGKNRFKILAYDLTIFLKIIHENRPIPHFLIHDGVFHGIDKHTIIRVINNVHSEFLQNQNFQYIITANEGELSIIPETKNILGDYTFELENTRVATYKDNPDEMIFKREY